ncbi:hypothetical protein, partial [Candidatus Venteria ishoeyi]|uniref:hypothetical protein n=1 Tax=Candidatus Venteria ishoeyi TaxID=1899563 RepID=UPI0011B0B977
MKKIYRFALYGLSSSGKTCILAALAMARQPDAEGYTGTWCPPENQDKSAKKETRQRSKEWIRDATERLSRGDIPQPNPTGEEQFVFEYEFQSPEKQSFRIEIIDYSGELVNPQISDSELAQQLRQHFKDMDGILVLAEAPYQDAAGQREDSGRPHGAQAHKDLHDMQQAFTLLRGVKQEGAILDTPVVLLVNKWDRYSEILHQDKAGEFQKLEDFLHALPAPPHKGLFDVLQNSVKDGDFKAFPVSALGGCSRQRNDDAVLERPIQVNPLASFGLESAFVWLAQRHDTIDLAQYLEQSKTDLKHCRQQGKALLQRFPPKTKAAQQVKSLMKQCRNKKLKRGLTWTFALPIFVLSILLGAETVLDYNEHSQKVVGVADNPQANDTALQSAEHWLTGYLSDSPFRHWLSKKLVLTPDAAKTQRTQIQKGRDTALWQRVEESQIGSAKVAAAQQYLQSYPNGTHANKALRVQNQLQLKIQNDRDTVLWQRVEEARTDSAKVAAAQQYLKEHPNGAHANEAL